MLNDFNDNALCSLRVPVVSGLRGRIHHRDTEDTEGAQRRIAINVLIVVVAALLFAPIVVASNETEVRATVEQVFQNLKSKNYDALYETLPANTRSRMTRERFTSALRRAQDNYALDRIEIGKIRASGNIAIVDTVLYGRLVKPFDAEGKIVAQQYLVREDGKWRVATGDRTTTQKFLAANPAFARQFRIQSPRVFVKKDNGWVEFTLPKRRPQ